MSAPHGTVRYLRSGQTLDAQVGGWARMPLCLPLRHLAEQSFADGVCVLRIDLRHCTHLDSTFLGTLLFLKRASDRRGPGQFALVSPSSQCQQIFQQMGLQAVYPVVWDEPPAGEWVELVT